MKRHFWWGIALAALALLYAGCGVSNTVGACPDPNSSAPTQTSGDVVIATDHSTYAGNGTMTVTITNHLATNIYAWDHQASCSILSLEMQQGQNWTPVAQIIAGCPLGRVTLQVTIAPGKSYTATIHAGYLQPGIFAAGNYRLVFNYSTVRGPPTATTVQRTPIYSQMLAIEDCGVSQPTAPGTKGGHGTITPGTPVTIPPTS